MKRKKTGFTPLEMKVSSRASQRFLTGFTMVEILTVVGIIAILVAVLVPTLSMVRRIAKETQQKAQLTAIDLALLAFKSDDGDYPPSDYLSNPDHDYCGAQMLAEALLGWDLMGFHPDSEWQADGEAKDGGDIYDLSGTDKEREDNLRERRGPYLDVANANVYRLSEWFVKYDIRSFLAPDTYVLCDVFATKLVTLTDGTTVRAGTPILYYRANTSSKTIEPPANLNERIYNAYDNYALINATIEELIALNKIRPYDKSRTLANTSGTFARFYDYITDPKVAAMDWPYRADSYILISAGADGLYGTEDDICNF